MSTKRRRFASESSGVRLALIAALAAILVAACGNPFSLTELVDGPDGRALEVSPANAIVAPTGSVTIQPTGGIPPYTFEVVDGDGTIVENVFTAPNAPGDVRIAVRDSVGTVREVIVSVQNVMLPLAIVPAADTVFLGDSITFAATGGSGSYSFSLTQNQSGGSLTGAVYTAGFTPGTDVVTATDDELGITATATLTVATAPLPNHVDYDVTSLTLGTHGVEVRQALDGTLTIANLGPGAGGNDISWTVYASTDETVGGGDYVVASGVLPPLGADDGAPGGSDETSVAFSGSWPGQPDSYFLVASLSAVDDTAIANNFGSNGTATVISGASGSNVDYLVPNFTLPSTSVTTGDSFSVDVTIRNAGVDAGNDDVFWTAYLSPGDAVLNIGADQVVDADRIPALAADDGAAGGLDEATVTVDGTWPATAGTWYLIVATSASDEVTAGDYGWSSPPATVAPPDFDYVIDGFSDPQVDPTPTAGAAINEQFRIVNPGPDDGTSSLTYWVYLSSDPTWSSATDQLVDSGTRPRILAGAERWINVDGTWPTNPGTWYLIAREEAEGESNPGDVLASAAFDVLPLVVDVDYAFTSGLPAEQRAPNDPLSVTLDFSNTGGDAGTENLVWKLFLSTDAVFDASDALVESGTVSGGLAASDSTSVTANGSWPGTAGQYYLIARLSAGDDVDTSNNTIVSAVNSVLDPGQIDYEVTTVTIDNPTDRIGNPVDEGLTITNTGGIAGSDDLTWTVFFSDDDAFDGADSPLDSGMVTGGLAGGAVAQISSISAFWPAPAGDSDVYLIVRIAATDDADGTNNEFVQGPYTIIEPPDYTIELSDPVTTDLPIVEIGGNTGETLGAATGGTHQFRIVEQNGEPGDEPISWRVYISDDDTLDAGDPVFHQGVSAALGALGSHVITIPATLALPATPGPYRFFFTVDAADDVVSANDVLASPVVAVWTPTGNVETHLGASVPEENERVIGQHEDFGILLNVGDSVVITGTMDESGFSDLFLVRAGTGVDELHIVATWASEPPADYIDISLFQLGDDPIFAPYQSTTTETLDEDTRDPVTGGFTGLAGLADRNFYVGVFFFEATTADRPYTLTITAYGP